MEEKFSDFNPEAIKKREEIVKKMEEE